jgi:hypothetical protein
MNVTFSFMKIEKPIRRFRFCGSILLILLSGLTVAAQSQFPNIEAFLKTTLQNEDRLNFEAKGDLNADGHDDWAGVIQRRKLSAEATVQLYVLLHSTNGGGYRVAEKSLEVENSSSGCCYVENLEIRKGSLFIQNNFKDSDGIDAVTHQFKLYDGKWRLIGLRIYEAKPSTDLSVEIDLNLLTGIVIKKTQKGENKPITRSHRQNFSRHFLKDFDFSQKPFIGGR